PAPFVVAHLQLGLMLQNLGAPLGDDGSERVGVYLTNALTGWEPPKGPKQHLMFKEMEEERDAAEHVKREVPVLVVLGNPPYNAFAGVSPEEEQGLVEAYKKGLISEWGIKKFNLDDLYIRFFRLAERRIAEKTGEGVVCYISNFSYLSDPSFVVMRKRFLAEFDSLWFDSLNGDSRETGKLTPEGKPDPSVFSTQYNREGIRVGTAIGLMVRKQMRNEQPIVRSRQLWGVTKREDLLESLKLEDLNAQYRTAVPIKSNRFSFVPLDTNSHYQAWPKLTDLCAESPSNGLMEKRGGALMDIDRDNLEKRMQLYYDPSIDWETILALNTGLTEDAAGFVAKKARSKVQTAEEYQPTRLRRYTLRPFDTRWCYYSEVSPLWNRSRPTLWRQCWEGNTFLLTRFKRAKEPEGPPYYFTPYLSDDHLLTPDAVAIPFRLRIVQSNKAKKNAAQGPLFSEHEAAETISANLSQPAREYLTSLGITNPDTDAETAGLIWMHALAIGYAPAYLNENADGIRQDWPRVPLPDSKQALEASSRLGREIAALLDTETPVPNVTTGTIRPELKSIAVISSVGGASLNPEAGDLALTAGWGHGGKGGVTMPGKGKIVARDYSDAELEAVAQGVPALNLSTEVAARRLGETTLDIYLNEKAYWKNVPAKVWDYTIGGYQVIKKWLSYREKELLGRALTADEAREVMAMARRIAAILLLEPALDANYESVKQSSYAWPSEKERP
ncbi:MAG TPA: type ISP restriction/modification enzyme, partial [Blastocatellia bacterium]